MSMRYQQHLHQVPSPAGPATSNPHYSHAPDLRPTFHGHASSHITSARAYPPRTTLRRPRNLPNKTLLPQSPRPIPLLTLILSSSRAVDLRTRQSTHVGDHERTRSVSERRNHPAGSSTRADSRQIHLRDNFCRGARATSAKLTGRVKLHKLVFKLQPINSKTFKLLARASATTALAKSHPKTIPTPRRRSWTTPREVSE